MSFAFHWKFTANDAFSSLAEALNQLSASCFTEETVT